MLLFRIFAWVNFFGLAWLYILGLVDRTIATSIILAIFLIIAVMVLPITPPGQTPKRPPILIGKRKQDDDDPFAAQDTEQDNDE